MSESNSEIIERNCLKLVLNFLKKKGWFIQVQEAEGIEILRIYSICLKGEYDEKVMALLSKELTSDFFNLWVEKILEEQSQIWNVLMHNRLLNDLESAIGNMRTVVRNAFLDQQLKKIDTLKKTSIKKDARLFLHEEATCSVCGTKKRIESDTSPAEFRILSINRVFWCETCNKEVFVKMAKVECEE